MPLDVEWTLQRTSPLSLPELLTLLEQPVATRLLTPKVYRFSMQGHKKYFWDQYKGGKKADLRELAFDEECFYESGGTSVIITEVAKLSRRSRGRVFTPIWLEAAGIFIPNTAHTIGGPAQSLVLHLVAQGAAVERVTNETAHGVRCLRIDVAYRGKSLRFFLDPALNYASRRQEEWSDSEHISTTVCEQFQRLKPPLYLPKQIRIDYFNYMKRALPERRRPLVTELLSVSRLDQSPLENTRFVVLPEVGMWVFDTRLPEAREFNSGYARYVMPSRAEDMHEAIDKASAELREAQASQKRAGWQLYSVTTAVAVGIVVVIVGIAYLGLRWRMAAD